MANVNLSNSTPSTVSIPVDYPMVPQPGKISLLFDANKKDLYRKFSPWDYDGGNIFGFNQPYVYYFPDDPPNSFMKMGDRGLTLGQGVNDVKRVTKFIASGRGVIFIAKQFLLQGFQPFDETNIYNPTEVILSATANLTGGILQKPKRHIDKSGGLLGGLAGLIGVSVSRSAPPPSTVAAGNGLGGSSEGTFFGGISLLGNSGQNRETEVLPIQNYGNGTGLLRAKTANKARSILQQKWGIPDSSNGGGVLGFLKGIARSIIPQTFSADKQNYKQRADEDAYGWMLNYYNNYTAKNTVATFAKTGLAVSFMGISLKSFSNDLVVNRNTQEKNLFEVKYYKSVKNKPDNIYIESQKKEQIIITKFENSVRTKQTEKIQNDKYVNESSKKVNENRSIIDKAFEKYAKEGSQVTSKDLVKESNYNKKYEGNYTDDELKNGYKYNNTEGSKANKRSTDDNTKLNDISKPDSPISQFNESLKRVINNINNSKIYNVNFDN
jgi:hypothetical protein